MKNCTIHTCPQRSQEWHELRRGIFTATDFAPFFLEARTETQKNARRKLLVKKIREQLAKPCAECPEGLMPYDQFEIADQLKDERMFEGMSCIQRGNAWEDEARREYESLTMGMVTEVGIITHNDLPIGCSPDGLIQSEAQEWHGLELKCPEFETQIIRLLDGGLPDAHKFQVHGSMCVTGLGRWDFMSFYRGLPPLLVTVHRDEFTEQLMRGIRGMCDEMEAMRESIAEKFNEWKA